MTATFYVGDAVTVMNTLPEKSVDLILTSPPFLALRSYLPQDHPDKALEGGSQATPGAYVDWLLDVVEACARVLARHGSLCFELGDTYSGSGESGWERDTGEYRRENRSKVSAAGLLQQTRQRSGWPLAKSLSLIPETFRFAMVYGVNPHTGRRTEPWRLRNVIRWVRPNPPVGALGDKFRPATSELMVFCKSKDRFFDLDAVREASVNPIGVGVRPTQARVSGHDINDHRDKLGPFTRDMQMAGAPPLDWWNIPPGGYPGAHYAVWPPELLVKPIKAMCPEKVCRRCGEASRRIVKTVNATEERLALADYLRQQREAQAITVRELTAAFPSASGGMTGCVWNWENAANVPTAEQWPTLKALLDLDDRFDTLVTGERAWTESEIEYEMLNSNGPKNAGRTSETAMGNLTTRANRMPAPDRFSDCGHDDYRPGLVLDPFAGSGTTLAVATGHGRDAIGIDLDERNYELSLDRVGPLILSRGTEPAGRINS